MEMMNTFNDSPVGEIGVQYGHEMLFIPDVRIVIRDSTSRILLIKQDDRKKWELPAGTMELDESVIEAARREVFEVTGLSVGLLRPFAFYLNPKYQFEYHNGNKVKQFTMAFLTEDFSGELWESTDETYDIGFFFFYNFPEINEVDIEIIQDLFRYEGTMFLK